MALYLGIDTSNYTTSAALYDPAGGEMRQQRKLLCVKPGEKGLRQSDALFQHVRELPSIIEKVTEGVGKPDGIGYSSKPRDAGGSYMPCFLAGIEAARCAAACCGVSAFEFSHQAGHIAAALYSVSRLDLLERKFIAFHVSGGTTEALLFTPGQRLDYKIEIIGASLDLKAGQAVDRTGLMLGLDFPAGPALEKLALESDRQFKIHPCLKGTDCCLSGIENRCLKMKKAGEVPRDIARYCLEYIKCTLDGMTESLLERFGSLPLVFAGGVMSNSIIRDYFTEKYGALFAKPGFSSDNAAGIAVLTKIKSEGL